MVGITDERSIHKTAGWDEQTGLHGQRDAGPNN
jgi:hypothetical protein